MGQLDRSFMLTCDLCGRKFQAEDMVHAKWQTDDGRSVLDAGLVCWRCWKDLPSNVRAGYDKVWRLVAHGA